MAIKKNKTGEIKMCRQQGAWDIGCVFLWTEGAMSCDCNRHIEFHRDESRSSDIECSDDLYSVLYAEFDDGTKIDLDES